MKFRFHRGLLADSLATTQEFKIENILNSLTINKKDTEIKIRYYGYDERCKQDLYIVSQGNDVIGFIF